MELELQALAVYVLSGQRCSYCNDRLTPTSRILSAADREQDQGSEDKRSHTASAEHPSATSETAPAADKPESYIITHTSSSVGRPLLL